MTETNDWWKELPRKVCRQFSVDTDGEPLAVARPADVQRSRELVDEERARAQRGGGDPAALFERLDKFAGPLTFMGFEQKNPPRGKPPRIFDYDGNKVGRMTDGDLLVKLAGFVVFEEDGHTGALPEIGARHLQVVEKEPIVFTLDAARAVVIPWHVREGGAGWQIRAKNEAAGFDYIVCECEDKGLAEFIVGHHNDRHEAIEADHGPYRLPGDGDQRKGVK